MDVEEISVLGMPLPTFLQKVLFLGVVITVAYVADKAASRGLRRVLDVSNVPSASIFVNLARVGIWVVAFTVVLQPVFGIEPNAVITALGVTGVAISLGVQDTVSNLIGGLFLMIGKAIKIGDYITVDSIKGQVTDIDLRSTTVLLRSGNTEVIPNSVLNKTNLAKLAPSNAGCCGIPVVIRPDADVDAVTREVVALVATALGDMRDPAYETTVRLEGFDAYGTKATVWVHVKDDVTFTPAQDAVARALQGSEWLAKV